MNALLTRRCIAVDPGQRRVKVMLAEARAERVEVLHALTIDLHEEGLLTQEEAGRHITRVLSDLGDYPISVVAPQQVAISHLLALPGEGKGNWRRTVEEEAQKLTGLSDISIIYGYQRLEPLPRNPNPLWVSVSREQDLADHLARLGEASGRVSEIINTSNALASAYIASKTQEERAVLVEIGAGSTALVVMEGKQPVYASSIALGGDFFTDRLSMGLGMSLDEAENSKRREFLLTGVEPEAGLQEAVTEWREELEKALLEWAREQGEGITPPNRIFLAGGPAQAPDLVDFLNASSPFTFKDWGTILPGLDGHSYAATYGAALAGLRRAAISPSLLPKPVRVRQRRIQQTVLLNLASVVLVLATLAALVTDTFARRAAVEAKETQLADKQAAHTQIEEVQVLLDRRAEEYNAVLPAAKRQRVMRDLLTTLSLMEEVRDEYDLWFLSFSDRRSYFANTTQAALRQSRSVSENGATRRENRRFLRAPASQESSERRERRSPGAFVVELAVLDEGRDSPHVVLRNVIEAFDGSEVFRNVDVMPGSERNELIDPRLALPGRTFAFNLDVMPLDLPLMEVEASEAQDEETGGG